MTKLHTLALAATLAVFVVIPATATAQPADAAAAAQQRRDAEHAREQAHRRDQENRRDEENQRDAEHRQDAENRRDEENRRDAEHRRDAQQRASGRQDALHRQDQGRGRGAALSADELIGHRVTSRDDRREVGKVTDLIVDEKGEIEAAVVRTGGIFGFFTKEVLVPWTEFEQGTDEDSTTLLIDMGKAALRELPAYTRD